MHESNRQTPSRGCPLDGRCTLPGASHIILIVWAKRVRQPAEHVSDPTPSLLFGVEENPGKAAGEGTRVPSLGNEVYY